MFEVGFRFQHDCPYTKLTQHYPDVVFTHWCNWEKDVMEISYRDLRSFQEIQRDLDRYMRELGTKVIRKEFSSSDIQLVVHACNCDRISTNVSSVLSSHNCVELQPTVYRDGWEWYRFLAFSQRDIKALFDDLSKVGRAEVVSRVSREGSTVRESVVVSVANLFGGLTQKQLEAIVVALRNDYYNVPKRVTTDEIAERMGVPRTTFEEHLRKAEGKVLRAVAPYLELKGVR
jgi:predicted DNA binding protein